MVQAVFPRIAMRFRGQDAFPKVVHLDGIASPTVKTIPHRAQQADQRLQTDEPDWVRLSNGYEEKQRRSLHREP